MLLRIIVDQHSSKVPTGCVNYEASACTSVTETSGVAVAPVQEHML